MKGVWFYKVIGKTGKPGLLPADDDALRVLNRMGDGEVVPFRPMRVRDLTEHRRYWRLMTMCAENCERIELPMGGVMLVHSKEDVHTAIKLCTGYFDAIFDAEQRPVAYIPKSTNFDEMTGDEWAEYWPHVVTAVCERVMPGVSLPAIEEELLKCMRLAA